MLLVSFDWPLSKTLTVGDTLKQRLKRKRTTFEVFLCGKGNIFIEVKLHLVHSQVWMTFSHVRLRLHFPWDNCAVCGCISSEDHFVKKCIELKTDDTKKEGYHSSSKSMRCPKWTWKAAFSCLGFTEKLHWFARLSVVWGVGFGCKIFFGDVIEDTKYTLLLKLQVRGDSGVWRQGGARSAGDGRQPGSAHLLRRHYLPPVRPVHGVQGGHQEAQAGGVQIHRRLPLQGAHSASVYLQHARPHRCGSRNWSRVHQSRNAALCPQQRGEHAPCNLRWHMRNAFYRTLPSTANKTCKHDFWAAGTILSVFANCFWAARLKAGFVHGSPFLVLGAVRAPLLVTVFIHTNCRNGKI